MIFLTIRLVKIHIISNVGRKELSYWNIECNTFIRSILISDKCTRARWQIGGRTSLKFLLRWTEQPMETQTVNLCSKKYCRNIPG